ncbi:hypothetical protein D1AOALGA4SA_11614 [Olavius algarvensis Delta 1 endosymbiont]|nr:hypothetical protein D1AOALGA4SA_11614 [Olavius algarvensis Delta 1 endosymbiont]
MAQRAVFFPIRLVVLLARGSALMKLHFKVRVGSVMGYFAFCRLG